MYLVALLGWMPSMASTPAHGFPTPVEPTSTQPVPVNSDGVVLAHRNKLSGVTAPALYVPQLQVDRGG